MVFGFGEGSVTLQLNKTNFAFGETIAGKLSLQLKKNKQARQLRVSIVAERKTTQYGRSGSGRSSGSGTTILFKTDVILDGERLYSPPGSDYDFKIQVPMQSAMPQEIQGTLGTALKAMQFLGGQMSQVKWFVEGVLDIPGGKDINKRIQISIQ
ncbi:MAG: hypothetical protein Q8N60_05825 [Candidatus Diapherotrites archaeon]|nr:hypothetical protein [Candidatus Diapherotrites archaeon]